MNVGTSFTHRGQAYECLDRFEHEIPAKWVWVYKLRSICPDCGERFICTATPTQRKNNSMPRRCERCRAPGIPVSPPPHSKKGPSSMTNIREKPTKGTDKPPGTLGTLVRPAPGCRFDPPGHAKFADGSVIQWGVATAKPEGTQVTLPVPLAVELWGVAADKADPGPVTVPLAVIDTNRFGFTIRANEPVDVGWIAVGR
jgi:hypothetical protein